MNDETACFHITGRGPMMDELSRLAKKLNVDSRIVFYGFHEDPWRIMVFCLVQKTLGRLLIS